jgi:WD40 repeat protein/tRNA A-37 threonylcarbamoyl transferase component Bud32
MPLYTCPNGHRWEAPAGPLASGQGPGVCPVCGATTAVRPAAGTTPAPTERGTGTDPGARTAVLAVDAPPLLPDYDILEEIGRGGMGIVYRARQRSRDRVVALKVIRQERLSHPEVVRRFRREVQAAARLSHPNIVLVYDSDQEGDTHFLAMEYVPGITLQRLVEQHGRLPVPQACDYVRQAALGLQHAHEQALVHRDIKPANLMVAAVAPEQAGPLAYRGAVLKVLDMGVARLYQLGGSQEELITTLTQDGAVLGTPDYIAPEQLENAHEADIRADLYSLGCTFHFLLTGQVPFPGGTLIQKLDKQRWATPAPVDQLRPDVPAGVAGVVRKLMAKRSEDRYQTPADLVAALDHLGRTGHLPAEPRPPALAPVRRLTGHPSGAWDVALSADGRLALSGGKDGTLRLGEVATGQEVRVLAVGVEVRAVALSGDGRLLLSAGGATLKLWDAGTGQELGRLVGHTDTVKSVAFAPDGRRAVSGGDDRTVRLWDVQGRREVRRFTGHTRDLTGVAFAPDGRHVLSGSRDQTLRLWDLQTGREARRFGGRAGMVLGVAVSADGRYALSGGYDTSLRLWDLGSGQELRRFQGHKQMVAAVAFAPDGRRVLSGSHDQTLKLWDLESTRELCCCEGHTGPVNSVAFAPDGRTVLSAGADGTLCVWELP